MNSEYPTLDLLDRYELRSAFVLLMLGARSGAHFQKLHDEVIPLECRFPRNLFIALKHERERMLSTGEAVRRSGSFVRPSDEVLLWEFNRARRNPHEFKSTTLRKYFESLLYEHSKRTNLQDGNIWNRGILVHWSDGEWDTGVNGTINGVPVTAAITFHLSGETVSPPSDIVVPEGFTCRVTRDKLKRRVLFHISSDQINYLKTQALLELPPWDYVNISKGNCNICYEFEQTDPVELPEPNEQDNCEIDVTKFDELLAQSTALGLPFVRTKPSDQTSS